MKKRVLSRNLAFILVMGCGPRAGGDEGGSSGGDPEGMWALGTYYSPPRETESTDRKFSIEINADHTALLEEELCGVPEPRRWELGWEVVDPDTIRFVEATEGEGVIWFGVDLGREITMHRKEDAALVQLILGGDTHLPLSPFGDYRRGKGCLTIEDHSLRCLGGAYVIPCDR